MLIYEVKSKLVRMTSGEYEMLAAAPELPGLAGGVEDGLSSD